MFLTPPLSIFDILRDRSTLPLPVLSSFVSDIYVNQARDNFPSIKKLSAIPSLNRILTRSFAVSLPLCYC